MEKEGRKGQVGEGVLLAFGQRSSPYWQDWKRMREEWVLVPTGEEEGEMGLLVGLVQTEPWPAAAVAAHSSALLAFLVVPFCYLHLSPIHRAAAAESLRAAAAGIGIGGVGFLQV